MPRPIFDVFTSKEGDAMIVVPMGQIDLSSTASFQAKMRTLCTPGARVILDCRQLTYINSTGIGMLVGFNRALQQSRGALVLCNVSADLLTRLAPLSLRDVLPVYPGRKEALTAVGVRVTNVIQRHAPVAAEEPPPAPAEPEGPAEWHG